MGLLKRTVLLTSKKRTVHHGLCTKWLSISIKNIEERRKKAHPLRQHVSYHLNQRLSTNLWRQSSLEPILCSQRFKVSSLWWDSSCSCFAAAARKMCGRFFNRPHKKLPSHVWGSSGASTLSNLESSGFALATVLNNFLVVDIDLQFKIFPCILMLTRNCFIIM